MIKVRVPVLPQAVVNIGLVGHVDHGKTTLTDALSGIWTDTHSEELRRGISIRLGYADTSFRRCPVCEPPASYTTKEVCPRCGSKTDFLRRVSFVDAPGHETLMATMLSGAAIMDGAVLVIAANEPCPQPQTKEHLMAIEIIGVRNIVAAQNKIELVSREKAIENQGQIREFLKSTCARDAPIIPISAIHRANIDLLIQAIEERIPTPEHDLSKPALMYVARSFDVNRPGTRPENLVGGVIGGSLLQGRLRVGDEIEVRPGIQVTKEGKTRWQPLRSEIASLQAGGEFLDEAVPGGLVGIGTKLDPSLTKADYLAGAVVGEPDTLPPVLETLQLEVKLMERIVGMAEELEVKPLTTGEPLMLNVGTATTVGTITSARDGRADVKLKLPVCAREGARAAISRRVAGRWRLIGYGIIG
ncbi:MAG: translation initiation factor IF-2 subunit gamma [Candidatus Hodarchaeaceae archaeon]|nr:translation initiation factor IF-2 subunit gamma [Candidatus Hodarchaeaceae archaeon]